MAVIQTGSNTAGVANVDVDYNLQVTTPQVNSRLGGEVGAPNYVGATRSFYEIDSGSLTGSPYLKSPLVSENRLLQVGLSTPLFDYSFDQIVQDTANWVYNFTGMTMTLGGGSLLVNSNNISTTSNGCNLVSRRYVALLGSSGLVFEYIASLTSTPQANEIFACGVGVPISSIALPTDGVWFQLTSAGLIGVINYNGTITQTGILPITLSANINYDFKIVIDDRVIEFWVSGVFLGETLVPSGNSSPFLSKALPTFIQYYNSGTVVGINMQIKIGNIHIEQVDLNLSKPYSHIQSSKGLMISQGQPGGTMGTTALYSNSLAVAAGVAMTNTTAALGSGLGGQFSALPTLAIGTDGIVCSYQNPIGSITQTPRTLIITGVYIDSVVTTTLVGGAVVYAYSLAYGHTAVSLATAESISFTTATTKAPRRIPVGINSFAANAAVGSMGFKTSPIRIKFDSPIVVNPGEFIALVAKNLGVVTTAGVITWNIMFDGYRE